MPLATNLSLDFLLLLRTWFVNQDRPDIVDIGMRGAGDDQISRPRKELVAVIACKHFSSINARGARSLQYVWSDETTGIVPCAINAIA